MHLIVPGVSIADSGNHLEELVAEAAGEVEAVEAGAAFQLDAHAGQPRALLLARPPVVARQRRDLPKIQGYVSAADRFLREPSFSPAIPWWKLLWCGERSSPVVLGVVMQAECGMQAECVMM